MFFGRLLNSSKKLGLLYGLCDEIVCAFLDGFDGDFNRSVTGIDDDLDFLVDRLGALQ